MDKAAFGKRMNSVRKEKQVTSEGLSEKCEINAVFVRQIENATKLPSLPTFVKICNVLQVSPNYLLADSLDTNEQDQYDNLWKKLRTLTPKQIDMVTAMIEMMVDKLEE